MKRVISILLAMLLLLGLCACGGTATQPVESAESTQSTNPEEHAVSEAVQGTVAQSEESVKVSAEEASLAEETPEPETLVREVQLPISDGESLSLWIRLNFMDFDPIQSNYDSPVLLKAQELTGVNMEYVEVSSASEGRAST